MSPISGVNWGAPLAAARPFALGGNARGGFYFLPFLIVTSHSLSKADLAQFTGSVEQYLHPLFKFRFTEGVRFVAIQGGAWWLIEAIASWQHDPKLKRQQDFQVWTLRRTPENGETSADLVCTDGNDGHLVTQHIEYTDFPLDELQIYWIDGVMLLPSEY